jgi:hypothetical protein
MALPIVLTSLADKRARYIAEAEYHQKRAEQAREAVAKIDAAMALWEKADSTCVVSAGPTERTQARSHGGSCHG